MNANNSSKGRGLSAQSASYSPPLGSLLECVKTVATGSSAFTAWTRKETQDHLGLLYMPQSPSKAMSSRASEAKAKLHNIYLSAERLAGRASHLGRCNEPELGAQISPEIPNPVVHRFPGEQPADQGRVEVAGVDPTDRLCRALQGRLAEFQIRSVQWRLGYQKHTEVWRKGDRSFEVASMRRFMLTTERFR